MNRILVVLLVLACSPVAVAHASPVVRGSVEQVQVTGAKPGEKLLLKRHGDGVALERAGELGGAVFRRVAPGGGYRVAGKRVRVLPTGRRRRARRSTSRDPTSGYGYLTHPRRDQARDQRPPAGAAPGPYPTLVEYSGYGYANPDGGESWISQIANLLGYAVVDVNMRGTGCSGGAFDFFEPLQGLDGYDVIETVARQPWVLHGKVGMVGVSYGGISQLFVAATQPPSLAAITPLSVIDNTADDALSGRDPQHRLRARVGEGPRRRRQAGARDRRPGVGLDRIQSGDDDLRGEPGAAPRGGRPARQDPRATATTARRSPIRWRRSRSSTRSTCPTSSPASGPTSRPAATARRSRARFTGTEPQVVHVHQRHPHRLARPGDVQPLVRLPRALRRAAESRSCRRRRRRPRRLVYQPRMGVPASRCRPTRSRREPTYEAAQAAFEALPPVRILFDNGAGGTRRAAPVPGFEQSFARLPGPGHAARAPGTSAADGTLTDAKPRGGGPDTFTWNAARAAGRPTSPATPAPADGLWTATPAYDWTQNPAGTALSYVDRRRWPPTPRCSAPARCTPGSLVGAATSTCRRRSPRSGPTARRPSSRAAGCAPSARKLDRSKSTLLEPVLEPAQARRAAAARRAASRSVDGPALLPGPRLPGRIADPGDDRGARRRPADLGVRRDEARGRHADGRGRPLARAGRRA